MDIKRAKIDLETSTKQCVMVAPFAEIGRFHPTARKWRDRAFDVGMERYASSQALWCTDTQHALELQWNAGFVWASLHGQMWPLMFQVNQTALNFVPFSGHFAY